MMRPEMTEISTRGSQGYIPTSPSANFDVVACLSMITIKCPTNQRDISPNDVQCATCIPYSPDRDISHLYQTSHHIKVQVIGRYNIGAFRVI